MKFTLGLFFCVLCAGLPTQAVAAAWPLDCAAGAMTLDGHFSESDWSLSAWQSITPTGDCSYVNACGTTDTAASAQFNAVWDQTALWIGVNVSDPGKLSANAALPWNGSGVEIFLDLNNAKAGYTAPNYNDPSTYQWCIAYDASAVVQFHNTAAAAVSAASVVTPGTGYQMEVELPWSSFGLSGPPAGGVSGLEIAVDVSNAAGNARDHQLAAFNAQVNPFDVAPVNWQTISYAACLPTPTDTISQTLTASPTPSSTITQTLTASPVPTHTITQTLTVSPTPTGTITQTLTVSPTWTASVSDTDTTSPTATDTATDTRTVSPTRTESATRTSTASPSATRTFSATRTPAPSRTPSPTPSPRPSATPRATASASPLPGSAIVTLQVYDSANLLVRQVPAGSSAALLGAVSLSQSPYDPGQGPLLLSQGAWAFAFDGKDGSGAVLRNGLYILVLESRQGGASATVRVQVQVLGKGGPSVSLAAAPNPSHGSPVTLRWLPALPAELKVYGLGGALVRDLGTVGPPQAWNLDGPGGAPVSAGLYLVSARVPGQREPSFFKIAVLR